MFNMYQFHWVTVFTNKLNNGWMALSWRCGFQIAFRMASVEDSPLLINDERGTQSTPRTYPFKALAFIMTSTVLQRYVLKYASCYNPPTFIISLCSSFTGAQSVLELFFSKFVFICSSVTQSNVYGTVGVNVFIAVNQLSALTGGIAADHLLGNFHTQNFSNVLGSIGILLVLFFTWQYMPSCCRLSNDSSPSSYCLEDFHQERIISSWSISSRIPSYLSIVLIATGCVVGK